MTSLHLQHPQALWAILLAVPVLALALWRSRSGMSRRGEILALGVRALWLLLCLAAAAGPVFTRTRTEVTRPRIVVVQDCSQSVQSDAQDADRKRQELVRSLGRNVEVTDLRFAGRTWKAGDAPVEADQTDIEAALEAANALSMENPDTRVIVLTDGRATRGSAVDAATRLAMRGAQVHVISIGQHQEKGPHIVQVDPPVDGKLGMPSALRVTVRSDQGTRATVRLVDADGVVADQRSLPLAGERTLVLRFTPKEQGMRTYSVDLVTGATTQPAGASADTRRVSVFVEGPPRLLVADNFVEETAALRKALDDLKIPIDVLPPDRWPKDLGPYAAVILSDFSGKELDEDQRLALRKYVEQTGGGVVFIAGGNVVASRWRSGMLAEMLPVVLQDRQAEMVKKRPEVAVCFVLDHSGSMGQPLANSSGAQINKLDLVKAAAITSLQVLPENAQVAVVSFDTKPTVVVSPTPVAQKEQIAQKVDTIGVGGGTCIAPAVREGLRLLSTMPGERYLIVLTDGRTERPAGDHPYWDQLTDEARQARTSWTSIAVGRDADTQLMEYLAQRMGGRYFFCETGDQIPKVFLEQAKAITKVMELKDKPFRPRPGPAAARLKDLSIGDMPELQGRVKATAKDQTDTMLLSDTSEPLLTSWQFGLGRVVTFTSDAKNAWGKLWVSWKGYSPFWVQVVQSVMHTEPPLHVRVRSQVDGSNVSFYYTVTDEKGRPAADLQCKGELRPADGAAGDPAPLQWKQLGPGAYQASAELPAVDKPYVADVVIRKTDGKPVHHCALVSSRQSAEMAATGPDASALAAIAQAGGGICSEQVEPIASLCAQTQEHTIAEHRPLWPPLIITAMLLWLADMLVRKFL